MAHDLLESDNVDVDFFIEDEEWEVVEAEAVLTTRSTPDYVDMVITPSEGVSFPSTPQLPKSEGGYLGREFTLDVDTELRADTPGPEVTRIFTGAIGNMTALGDYTYEAIGYDPTQQPFASSTGGGTNTSFMNSTINIAPASPAVIRAFNRYAISYGADPYEPGDRKILISDLVSMVLEEAGVTDFNINLADGGIHIGEHPKYGYEIRKGYDYEITFSQWEVPVKEILDRTTSAAQADWWFDRYGKFNFGPRIPNENIFAYELEYITDASDGKTSPPYQSVQVIGDGVVSEEGWSRSSLVNETPVNTRGNVDVNTDEAELVEPTFTYRNMEINTQQEADNVKEDILEQLREQTGTGDVTVVGFPEVRPGDGIQMPNTERQPMGGERYGVEQVTHRLNSSDGFITKIKVSGMVGEQEALYDEDIPELESDLEAQWRVGRGGRFGPTII